MPRRTTRAARPASPSWARCPTPTPAASPTAPPAGERTVEEQHATDDGRTVRVRIAGSLDEARRAGLQHPNCRHSLSAYLPGVTTAPTSASRDPDGYEATQRQREIERQIRKWKRREAAALDDDQARAARAKVRAWQRAQREHLAAHPELIRKPQREQIGAGNLPDRAPAPPADAMQAARVRSGDDRTLGEMRDDQLGAAIRAGALDQRDIRRIEAEADRRDEAARRDALFPGGRLLADLGDVPEAELGWALRYARPAEAEQIAAEIDRRYPVEMPAAPTGTTPADTLAARDQLDDVLDPMPDPDGWGEYALDADPLAGLTGAARWAAERERDAEGARRAYTREQIATMYREHVYAQYLAAEDALRGVLLNRRAAAEGIDPITLFSGPAHVAYARASEELRRWWQDHPRTTLAEYTEQVTGVRTDAGDTARASRTDRDNRL
ncbi:phage minor capsid protein [Streptomyces xiamenensis]|uniref:phage minor capsid protein n=1 Tax=Streptomyces xiamenensis TaxID=408015 RepID=UPI0035D84319